MIEHGSFNIMDWLRFRVAEFAVRFCGIPNLFWAAPQEWEEYMSEGEPYKESEEES